MTQEHRDHPAESHRYITTHSLKRISSLDVKTSDIDLEDMVRGLAMTVRFRGQLKDFYSVLEHQLLVAKLARSEGASLEIQRACMLHDGHEYLTGDFPSPYKHDVPVMRLWEGKIERTFREALNLPNEKNYAVWEVVKFYDMMSLHLEAYEGLSAPPDWLDPELVRRAYGSLGDAGLIGYRGKAINYWWWKLCVAEYCNYAVTVLGMKEFTDIIAR